MVLQALTDMVGLGKVVTFRPSFDIGRGIFAQSADGGGGWEGEEGDKKVHHAA